MLNSILSIVNKNVILGGDFNLFFKTTLETQGGNPILKKKFLARFTEIKETLDLCDIRKIKNPKSKRFTFHQNHVSGCIQRRLDYVLISNYLQETVIRAEFKLYFAVITVKLSLLLHLNQITREEKVCGNLINLCCLMINTLTN